MFAPFDLDRLDADERALWDEHFAGPLGEGESELLRVWGFADLCMLELSGIPEAINEYARENREGIDLHHQYLANLKAARARGEI